MGHKAILFTREAGMKMECKHKRACLSEAANVLTVVPLLQASSKYEYYYEEVLPVESTVGDKMPAYVWHNCMCALNSVLLAYSDEAASIGRRL